MTGEARPISGFKLWLCVLLAFVIGPAGLVGIAGPLPEAQAAPTVITSQTLTADTVWTTAGSPYCDILTTPGTITQAITGGNFTGGRYYIAPDGRGAAFDADGVFQYFGVFTP